MTWSQAEAWVARGWAVLVERTDDRIVIETNPWFGPDGSTQGPVRFTVHRSTT